MDTPVDAGDPSGRTLSEPAASWVARVRSLPAVPLLERLLAPAWRRELLAILVIVGVYVETFFQAQKPPGGTDDCAYFEYAAGMDAGAPHHRQRFALLGTVKLAQAIFGYTSSAYYAVPFVYTLGMILASYFAARSFMGIGLGLIAALMVLALPEVLSSSSWLLPDIPSMFWTVLGVTLLVRAFASSEARLPLKRALGSGVCFFLAVSTKESAAVLLLGLGCFPLALMSTRAWKILLLTAAATVTLALVEVLVVWEVFGDPWYRLHAVRSGQLPQMERAVGAEAHNALPEHITWTYLATRFLEATASDRYSNGWHFLGLGYWYWLCVSLPLALMAAVLGKNRLLLGLFGFTLWSYLSLTFALSSFDPLIPMVLTLRRYFLVVLIWLPILVLAGWSCFWTWPFQRPLPQHWRALRLASALGVIALYITVSTGTARAYLRTTLQTFRNGNAELAEYYDAVMRFTASGREVKRVVGPRRIRSAGFTWPTRFEIFWRRSELESGAHMRAGDFLIANEPLVLQVPSDLTWQEVGKGQQFRYFHFDDWNTKRGAGRHGLVAVRASALKRYSRVRLSIRLRLAADDVVPDPLHVVLDYGAKTVPLETLEWRTEGNHAHVVIETTQPFATRGVRAIALEFDAWGPGHFRLNQTKFRLIDAKTKEKSKP